MKRFYFLMVLGILFINPAMIHAQSPAATDFLQAEGKLLKYRNQTIVLKGTNFDNIGALGANIGSNNVNDIYFYANDYAELAKQGGNHVRLGLSFSWYKNQKTIFFQKMDEQISFARQNNLWLIFNMFTTPGNCYEGYGNTCGFWNSPPEQQQLKDFWIEMATRYKNEPVVAGYDILNEPTPATDCTEWFPKAKVIRDAIASIAPNQLVFIETCSDPGNDLKWNNPPTGKNIVYEVHEYSPMDMSHDNFSPGSIYPGYANEWFGRCYYTKETFTGTIYPGDNAEDCANADVREHFGINWANQQNVPIYIGEWGATSRLNGYELYYQHKAELYRDWGVNHAQYTWKHQTKVTGGDHQWGIYPDLPGVTTLRLDEPGKLNAVKISWQGAIRPQFSTSSTPTTAPTAGQVAGDVTGDGLVTVLDVKETIKKWLTGTPGTADQVPDGKVNALDVIFVMKRL